MQQDFQCQINIWKIKLLSQLYIKSTNLSSTETQGAILHLNLHLLKMAKSLPLTNFLVVLILVLLGSSSNFCSNFFLLNIYCLRAWKFTCIVRAFALWLRFFFLIIFCAAHKVAMARTCDTVLSGYTCQHAGFDQQCNDLCQGQFKKSV